MMAPDEYFLNLNSIPSLHLEKSQDTLLLCWPRASPPLQGSLTWALWKKHICDPLLVYMTQFPCLWVCHIPRPFLGWGQCWTSRPISFSMQQRMFQPCLCLTSTLWVQGSPPSLLLSCIWRPSSWEWGLFLADVTKTKTRSSWKTVISWALIVLWRSEDCKVGMFQFL